MHTDVSRAQVHAKVSKGLAMKFVSFLLQHCRGLFSCFFSFSPGCVGQSSGHKQIGHRHTPIRERRQISGEAPPKSRRRPTQKHLGKWTKRCKKKGRRRVKKVVKHHAAGDGELAEPAAKIDLEFLLRKTIVFNVCSSNRLCKVEHVVELTRNESRQQLPLVILCITTLCWPLNSH